MLRHRRVVVAEINEDRSKTNLGRKSRKLSDGLGNSK